MRTKGRVSIALRAYRKKHKETQEELAKKGGLSQQMVAHLESGRIAPSYDTLEKLCKATGLEPNDFFSNQAPTANTQALVACVKRKALTQTQINQITQFIEEFF